MKFLWLVLCTFTGNNGIMKAITRFSVLVLLLAGWMPAFAQGEDAEVPGDHFSLEGALELFKKSSSPEEFEKMLNSPDAKVNNLDLNGDGYVDYIRVLDREEGNVHLFILQAVVSDHESQDVAVIELEKLANGKAVLQIVGDEDIYGVTTIIEPTKEVRTYAGTRSSGTVVDVWGWPAVQYVYSPRYVVWVSPWSWHMRPVWWRTWRPVTYVHYYSVWNPYRPYYSVCHTRRVVHGHRIYAPYRTTSVIVHNRHHRQVRQYRETYADSRNGRTRNDNRTRFTDEGNSSGRSTAGRTRSDYNVDRKSSDQRGATTATNRPASRERNVPVNRNSYNVKKSDAPATGTPQSTGTRTRAKTSEQNYDRGTTINQNRQNTQRQATRQMPETRTKTTTTPTQRTSDFSRKSSEAPAKVQRPATRERQAPATINRSSTPSRSNSNINRNSNSAPKVQRQQQMSRPSSTAPSRQSQSQRSSGQNSSDLRRGR